MIKYLFGGEKEAERAKRHLAAIGKALSNPKIISNQSAFSIAVQRLGVDDEESLLLKASECLNPDRSAAFLKETDKRDEPLALVEKLLSEVAEPQQEFSLSVGVILLFLKSNQGERFVGNDEGGNSNRRQWVDFRNAFISWYFQRKQSTVQDYLEDARKDPVDQRGVYQPSPVYHRVDIDRFFDYVLRRPLCHANGTDANVTEKESAAGVSPNRQ